MKPQRSSLSKLRSGSQVRGVQLKNKKNEVNPLATRTGVRTNRKTEDGHSQVGQSSSPTLGNRRKCVRGRHLVPIDSNLPEKEGKRVVKSALSSNINAASSKTSIQRATTSQSESSRKEALLRRSSRQASRERRVWSKQRLQKRQQLAKSGSANKADDVSASSTTSIGIIKRKAGRPPKRVFVDDRDGESGNKKNNLLRKDASSAKHSDQSEKRLGLRTGAKLRNRTRGLLRNNPKRSSAGSPVRSPVRTSDKKEPKQKLVSVDEQCLNEELVNTNTIDPAPDLGTDDDSDTEEKKFDHTGAISEENAFVFTDTKEENVMSDSVIAASAVTTGLGRDGQSSSSHDGFDRPAPKTELKNREQEKFDQDVRLTSLIIRESLQAPSLLTKAITPFSCHNIGSKTSLPGRSMSSSALGMGAVKNRTSFSSVGKSKLRSAISNRMGFTNYLKSKKDKDSVKAVSKLISLRRKQIGLVRESPAEKGMPAKDEESSDDSNQQANGNGPSVSRTINKNNMFYKSSTQHPNLGFHSSSSQEVLKIDAASSLLRKFRLNNVKKSAHGRSSKIVDLNTLRKRNLASNSRKKSHTGTASAVSKPGKADSDDLKKVVVGEATDAAISHIKKDWEDEPSPNKHTVQHNSSSKKEAVKEEAYGNSRINSENTHGLGVKFDCPVDYSPDLPISSTISKLQARVQSKNLGGDFQKHGGSSASGSFKNSYLLGKRSDPGFDEEGVAVKKKLKLLPATSSHLESTASTPAALDGESSMVTKSQTSPNSPHAVPNNLVHQRSSIQEASIKTPSPPIGNVSKDRVENLSSNSVMSSNDAVELVSSTEAVPKRTNFNSTVSNVRPSGGSSVGAPAVMGSSTVPVPPLEPFLGPLSPEALQDGKVSLFAALAQLVEADDDDDASGSDAKQTLTIHPAHKNSTDEELISTSRDCEGGALPAAVQRETGLPARQDGLFKTKTVKENIRKDSLPYTYSRLDKDPAADLFPMVVESSSNCSSAVKSVIRKAASEIRNHQQEHHGWPRLAENIPVKFGLRCRVHLPPVRLSYCKQTAPDVVLAATASRHLSLGPLPCAPLLGVVPCTKEAGHLGLDEPETSDSSDQSDDEEKENDDCLVTSATLLHVKKQVPSLIRVPHRPLMIKTPLKCPECPMQFCTVRSLLWHFGIHVSGDSNNNNDRVPVLQGLQMPWDRLPGASATALPATATSEVVSRNSSREGELTVGACRRAPLPLCHTGAGGLLDERETVARPGRSKAVAGRGPKRTINGEVVDNCPPGSLFLSVASEHGQLKDAMALPIGQNSLSIDGDSSSDVEVLGNVWDKSAKQAEVVRPGGSFSRTPLQSIRGKRNHIAGGSSSSSCGGGPQVGTAKGFDGLRLESNPFKYCSPFNSSAESGEPSNLDKPRGGRSTSSNQSINLSNRLSSGKRSYKTAASVFRNGKLGSGHVSSSQVITHNTPLFSTSTGVVATVLGTHTIETKSLVADNMRPLDLASPIPLPADQSLLTKDRRDKTEKNDVILKIPIPRLNKTSASPNTSVQGITNQVKETTKFVNIRPKVAVTSSGSGPVAAASPPGEGTSKRPSDGFQGGRLPQTPPLRAAHLPLDGSLIPLGSLHPRSPAPSIPSTNNTVSIQPIKKLAPTRTIAPFKNIAAKQSTTGKCLASGKSLVSTQTLNSSKTPATFRNQLHNKKIAPCVVSTPLHNSLTISSSYSPLSSSGLLQSNFSSHLAQRNKEVQSSIFVPPSTVSLPCGVSSPMLSVPDQLDTCGSTSDGIVMINPSLGLRIVTRSNTSTVDTVTSRPIMSSSVPDSNCLTFVPDSGYNSLTIVPQVGSDPPNKRYNSSPKTPDILTIVPQMDHSKGELGSPGRRSSLSAPTQIMTAAGKVSASQVVKLVLLPQQDNVKDKTSFCSAKSPEASTSSCGEQRPPKCTISPVLKPDKKHVEAGLGVMSAFRRGGGGQRKSSCTDMEEDDSDDGGMVIDDEKNVDDEQRDGMDPMTLCSVTMEDDSVGPDGGLGSPSPNDRSTSRGGLGLSSPIAVVSSKASLAPVTSGQMMSSANVTSGLASIVPVQQSRSIPMSSGFSPVVTFQAVSSSGCQPLLSDSGRRLPQFTTSSHLAQPSSGYIASSTAAPSSLVTFRCENSNTISREKCEPSPSRAYAAPQSSLNLPLVTLGQPFNYVASKDFNSTASSTCSNVSLTNTNVSLIPSEISSMNNTFCRPLITNSIVSNSSLAMVSNSMVPLVNNSILPLITSSGLPIGSNSFVPLASSNNVTLVPSPSIPLVSTPNVLPLLCTSNSNSVPFVNTSRVPLASASSADYPILFVAPNVPGLSTGAISSLSLQNMSCSTVPSSSTVNTSTLVYTNSLSASQPCSSSTRDSLGSGAPSKVVAGDVSCVGLAGKSNPSGSLSRQVSSAAERSTETHSAAEESNWSLAEDSPLVLEKESKSGEVSQENGGGGGGGCRPPVAADRSKYESRKYVCQFCERRFGWSTDLKRHVILHTGEKPFKCGVCGTAFTRKFLLQNHMKRMHLDKCNASDLWPTEK